MLRPEGKRCEVCCLRDAGTYPAMQHPEADGWTSANVVVWIKIMQQTRWNDMAIVYRKLLSTRSHNPCKKGLLTTYLSITSVPNINMNGRLHLSLSMNQ